LLTLVRAGVNVWLHGAAGGGKSTVAEQVANALDLAFSHISLNVQSQPSLLMGFIGANGQYVRTEFRNRYEHGGIMLLDEIANASGNLLTSTNTALANGSCAFPDGVVKRHPNFVCIAADNTAGNGANGTYSSRNKVDGATRERFVFLEWEYDDHLTRQVTLGIHAQSEAWLAWTFRARETVRNLNLNLIVSPRAAIDGARLLRVGLPYALVADAVVFKGIDTDTRTKVLSNVNLPS